VITAIRETAWNEMDALEGVVDCIDYADDEADIPARVAQLAKRVLENPPADEERPRIPRPVIEPFAHVRFRHVVFRDDRWPPLVTEVRADDLSLPINGYLVQMYRDVLRKNSERFDHSLFQMRTVFERADPSPAFVDAFQAGPEVLRSALLSEGGVDIAAIAHRLGRRAAEYAASPWAPPLMVSAVSGKLWGRVSRYSDLFYVPVAELVLDLAIAFFDSESLAAP
jgi:hypothetical protein